MFRFIMMIMLMAACFFAGRISAFEKPEEFVVENVAQAQVTPQEILALARNSVLKEQYPDLHRKLMIFLATPQVQVQLVNPNRSSSPIYQKLVELVVLIKSKLNQ